MRHQDLLDVAAALVERPSHTWRARAVSTAYYALFHALAEFCGRTLIGAWAPYQPFRHIYRSLDHGHARKVFEAIRRSDDFGEVIARVGEAFILLQKVRHEADYDPGYRVGRQGAIELLGRAREAISLVDALSRTERKLLAARLIGRTRS